jgi:similar to stage IV sporulation protein
MSVKQGQPAVGVGDTVEKGQLLISGTAVSTMGTTRTVHALGDVKGRTWHTLTVRMPLEYIKKVYVGHRSLKISMIFGGKRLNFYRNSSIFGDTCDTITMDFPMCMKDVFSLPVRLTVQRCEFWEEHSVSGEERSMEQQGREILHAALAESLAEEENLVSEHYASQTGNDAVTVTVMAECLEEFGVEEPISQGELREIRTQREEAVND